MAQLAETEKNVLMIISSANPSVIMNKYFISITAAILLAACSESEPEKPTAPPPAAKASKPAAAPSGYRPNPAWPTHLVGSELSYPPFEFKDKLGQPTGFEVELLQAIAQKEQFNVQFLDHKRGQAAETLNRSQFSIWASALSHTPERVAAMDLSHPFLDIKMVVALADSEENDNIKSLNDLKGKKIAISSESSKSFADFASSLTGSSDNILRAGSFYLAMREAHVGKASGLIIDSRVLAHLRLHNPAMPFRELPLPDTRKDLVFAVKKGNHELLNKINSGLAKVKADGSYNQLVQKWFGKQ